MPRIILIAVSGMLLSCCQGSGSLVNTGWFGETAIQGYDPVAYFTLKQPTKGSPEIRANYRGATWLFSSAEHRTLFEANPARYAPQYGGYCAYAMAEGANAGIDPHAWTIVDDRLYLNYDRNIQQQWEAERAKRIRSADEHWRRRLAQQAGARR